MRVTSLAAAAALALGTASVHATPVQYTLSTDIAQYTLNGVAYPSAGSGKQYASISFVYSTDSSDFSYVEGSGGNYFVDTTGTTTIYANGLRAGTATNPQELRFFYPNAPTFVLTDTTTLQNILSGTITTFGNGTAVPASLVNVVGNSPGGGFALDTSAGALNGDYGTLSLTTLSSGTSPTPEPSTLLLLATGSMGAVGALRRLFLSRVR